MKNSSSLAGGVLLDHRFDNRELSERGHDALSPLPAIRARVNLTDLQRGG